MLLSLPNASKADVAKLDELVASSLSSAVKNNKLEKNKKDLVKKIVSPVSNFCLKIQLI